MAATEGINLAQLSPQQLSQLASQLEQEVEYLKNSLTKLKLAQGKFVESKEGMTKITADTKGTKVLVPLTGAMYVTGSLCDTENVIVEIGTGYYAEKTTKDAEAFFERKVTYVQTQMEKLQVLLQEKFNAKRAITEILQLKIRTQQTAATKS